ncbi:MAG: hypothetical protein IPM79_19910 [Polyangiaceae bacterium]|nr:hypothetical protein [Polyangiaceae bacterium]MBK8939820.1 hypothetical protein [Polyangiaceae bacterium]
MKVVRSTAATLVFTLAAFAMVGSASCGGFSTEEAEARCDQEAEARAGGGCFTDAAYEQCVSAHEECGDDILIQESCPVSFSCGE